MTRVRKTHGEGFKFKVALAALKGDRTLGDGIGQVQPQFFVDVQRPRLGDEPLGQRRMDTPVAPFVGIGPRRAPDRLAEVSTPE